MTRDELVLRLQREYADRREQNLRLYDEKVAAACERCPGLKTLMDARHAALMGGLRNAMYPEKKNTQANVGLSAALANFSEKIARALSDNGLVADALAPVYTCALCRDEGYVYDPSRRMCVCFETELNHRMLAELGLRQDQTFENFREDLYENEGSASQRSLMRRNRDICKRYADAYPETEVPDLLFTGKSGLGKTFLLQAIAHRVTERGYGVQYISAYNLLDVMRKAYFENNSERLRPLMDAPLLLIDDLGTEPLMENITVTQLFNLLNERQNAQLHTIISTNLSIPELKTRYTERITSRLLDARRCKIVKFIGEDIREKLGKTGGVDA
jgi:DNA replication protein DnaC